MAGKPSSYKFTKGPHDNSYYVWENHTYIGIVTRRSAGGFWDISADWLTKPVSAAISRELGAGALAREYRAHWGAEPTPNRAKVQDAPAEAPSPDPEAAEDSPAPTHRYTPDGRSPYLDDRGKWTAEGRCSCGGTISATQQPSSTTAAFTAEWMHRKHLASVVPETTVPAGSPVAADFGDAQILALQVPDKYARVFLLQAGQVVAHNDQLHPIAMDALFSAETTAQMTASAGARHDRGAVAAIWARDETRLAEMLTTAVPDPEAAEAVAPVELPARYRKYGDDEARCVDCTTGDTFCVVYRDEIEQHERDHKYQELHDALTAATLNRQAHDGMLGSEDEEKAAYDALVEFVDANGLAYTQWDPRGPRYYVTTTSQGFWAVYDGANDTQLSGRVHETRAAAEAELSAYADVARIAGASLAPSLDTRFPVRGMRDPGPGDDRDPIVERFDRVAVAVAAALTEQGLSLTTAARIARELTSAHVAKGEDGPWRLLLTLCGAERARDIFDLSPSTWKG